MKFAVGRIKKLRMSLMIGYMKLFNQLKGTVIT